MKMAYINATRAISKRMTLHNIATVLDFLTECVRVL